ncbi:hypothetical protein FAES_0759 [Fibrella aestuarina BUZ 2]|uniref:YD repeat-containing protein n=1 Tax=Fibrella aestuarina BUZ 2 TaxID=1166018 RepID=I0K3R7_9BACT|nr:RHS repeat domain-containing protein [Fibrella aestuarina]CCG98770.1 hypothetical protein FAES_0759 [Fibrella aestuarina BUZ 2]
MTKHLAFALFFLTCTLGCKHNPTDVDPKGDETAKRCRLRVFTSTNVDYQGKTLTTYSMNYDAQGRLTGAKRVVTDPNSATLSTYSDNYEYDANGYVVKRTYAGSYDYKLYGQPGITTIKLAGNWILTYDSAGRVSEISQVEDSDYIASSTTSASRTGKLTYTYDAAGKLKTFTQVFTSIPNDKSKPAQTERKETTFTNGIATKFTQVPLGGTVAEEPYELNAQGLAVARKADGKVLTRYTYDSRGNLLRSENVADLTLNSVTIYEYDDKPKSTLPSEGALNPFLGGLIFGGAKGHPTFVPVGATDASQNNIAKVTFGYLNPGGQLTQNTTWTYTHAYNAKGFLTSTTMKHSASPDYIKQDNYEYADCQ